MKKRYLLLIMLILTSCDNFYGNEDLGNRYILLRDGGYRAVVLNEEGKLDDGGFPIIDENVINVNFNEFFIIVKTSKFLNPETQELKYWAIDKTVSIDFTKCEGAYCNELAKSGLIGPMDSINFYSYLDKRNIDLKFRDK